MITNMAHNLPSDTRRLAFFNKIDKLITPEDKAHLNEMYQAFSLACDPAYSKGDNEIIDILISNIESYSPEMLRGIAIGIAYSLDSEIRHNQTFTIKPHYQEILSTLENVKAILTERTVDS